VKRDYQNRHRQPLPYRDRRLMPIHRKSMMLDFVLLLKTRFPPARAERYWSWGRGLNVRHQHPFQVYLVLVLHLAQINLNQRDCPSFLGGWSHSLYGCHLLHLTVVKIHSY
jgi:hypothetical protein